MYASKLRPIVAGAYATIGVAALLRPATVPAVFGGSAPTSEARTEVRAVYAGIPLAFAASLIRAEKAPEGIQAGVVGAVRDASAGMAVARLTGCVVERRLRPWPTGAFIALEAGLAIALGIVDRRLIPCPPFGVNLTHQPRRRAPNLYGWDPAVRHNYKLARRCLGRSRKGMARYGAGSTVQGRVGALTKRWSVVSRDSFSRAASAT